MNTVRFILGSARWIFLLWPAAAAAANIWPIDAQSFRVMNTLSTLQFYGPTPGFHHGLDLMAPAGTPVVSPIAGRVSTGYYYERKSPYTYEVAVEANDGHRWEFHHLEPSTVPAALEEKAAGGGQVEAGELIGLIYDASPMGIPPHVHVNVISPEGYYQNPLRFLPSLPDEEPPVIRGIYLEAVGEQTLCQNLDASLPAGRYRLVLDAYDLLPPSNLEQSLYSLNVFVSDGENREFKFDQLPHKNFLKGADEIYHLSPVRCGREETFQNQVGARAARRFLYTVPMNLQDRGNRLHIEAADFAGNVTTIQLPIE